jgi:pilus assembly protein CpaF
MYAVVITDEGGVRKRLDFSKPELTVGRVQGNDIVLPKRNVSKQHARLMLSDSQAVVVDLDSTNGTWVNGRKITSPHPLKRGDKIYIADFILTVEPANDADRKNAAPKVSEPPPLPPKPTEPEQELPVPHPSMGVKHPGPGSQSPGTGDVRGTALPPAVEARATDAPPPRRATESPTPVGDPLASLLERLEQRIDVNDVASASMKKQERWSATRAAIAETFLAMQAEGLVQPEADMRQIAHVALHEAVGLGALDDLLSNESVKTIVVQGPERVLVDQGEGLAQTDASFSSEKALVRVARRLAAQAGRTLGEQSVLHGRLAFGPRVTILQAPLVQRGPVIELRMRGQQTLSKLAESEWMSQDAANHLAKAVAECRNIVVAGPRGSGVTEVLSALACELPNDERVVAVEAVPDLEIDRERVISITASEGGLSMTEAIEHGTRLVSDRLVLNDLSGAATLAALSAVLGREPGHLLGVECWSSDGALEGLMLAAGCGRAERACVAQIVGSTIDLVVATERGPAGPRVSALLEIRGHEASDVSFESVAT